MPSYLTHCSIVKRLYGAEGDTRRYGKQSFLKDNFAFLSLGCQGPDPLFYYGIVPFHQLHLFVASKRLGTRIHKSDARRFFKLLLDQCYGIDDPILLNRFRSFVLGQFSHYLMDKICHPYILSRTKKDMEGNPIKRKQGYYHTRLEAEIDSRICSKRGLNAFLSSPSEAIVSDPLFVSITDKIFSSVLKELFPDVRIPKGIYKSSMTNMKCTIRFMNKSSFRSKMVGKNMLSSLYIPKEKEFIFDDPLNEKKSIWIDPYTGKERDESFLELVERCYSILHDAHMDLLKNGFTFEVFSRYITGEDYNGLKVSSYSIGF